MRTSLPGEFKNCARTESENLSFQPRKSKTPEEKKRSSPRELPRIHLQTYLGVVDGSG